MRRRAAFLDKDGTLVVDVPYNVDPDRIVLAPGAAAGVQALAEAGYALVVVTNQSGVARGLFEEAALEPVRARLEALLGVEFDGWYQCPHAPGDGCACRKPSPGMLWRAAEELGLDLSRSWMVGDILNDVEAGHRAGCRSILIDNGNETEWLAGAHREPRFRAADMGEAARIITAGERLAA